MARISFAQWFKPERSALQSSSSELGMERLYLEARDSMSEVGTTDSCLSGCLAVFVTSMGVKTYCAAPSTETDMMADLEINVPPTDRAETCI